MSFLKKFAFWKRRKNRKPAVLRGILKYLLPCIRQCARSSPDNSRIRSKRMNLEDRKEPIESPRSTRLGGNLYENMEKDRQGRFYLHNYQVLGRLGEGGFGQVFVAKMKATRGRTSNDELFAVKVVPHSSVCTVEKEVLIRAVGHPFLVQFHSYFETKVAACYVMEYLEGGSLHSLLCRMGQLPVSAARFYAAEIILAVSFLHSCGIVHRDIKPGNVLLDRDGHCKLADFGLSETGICDGKFATTVCGSKPYMAPEIQNRRPYGCEVDWWSVGLVMYNMMVGKYDLPVFLHPIRYPDLTENAESILRMFLTRNPRLRLGARGDTRSIQTHPFFESVDWEAVSQKRVTPPVRQEVTEKTQVEPHVPVELDAPLEPTAPVEPAALVVPIAPEEPDVPVELEPAVKADAPVETEAPVDPDVPLEPDAPLELEAPVEPTAPVEPAAPVGPATLVEPSAPVEPAAPVEPVALEEPDAPVEPDVPEEMEAPAEPGVPVEADAHVKPDSPVEAQASMESDTPMEAHAPVESDALVIR